MMRVSGLDHAQASVFSGRNTASSNRIDTDTQGVMDALIKSLKAKRDALKPDDWDKFIEEARATDPLFDLARLCPLTSRSAERPRGYPGDAVILDYIYGIRSAETAFPPYDTPSADVFDCTSNSPAARAVRYRRFLIARLADEIARRRSKARVLSIASGHLREIELSDAALDGELSEWRAFDQDPLSLQVVDDEYAKFGALPQLGSVRDILTRRVAFEDFDFVYAAGLFDYLDAPIAAALTDRMAAACAPGGTVMIANFARDIPDVGYMEAAMDWRLILRSEDEVAVLMKSCKTPLKDHSIFTDPDRNIIFATAIKAD